MRLLQQNIRNCHSLLYVHWKRFRFIPVSIVLDSWFVIGSDLPTGYYSCCYCDCWATAVAIVSTYNSASKWTTGPNRYDQAVESVADAPANRNYWHSDRNSFAAGVNSYCYWMDETNGNRRRMIPRCSVDRRLAARTCKVSPACSCNSGRSEKGRWRTILLLPIQRYLAGSKHDSRLDDQRQRTFPYWRTDCLKSQWGQSSRFSLDCKINMYVFNPREFHLDSDHVLLFDHWGSTFIPLGFKLNWFRYIRN